MSNVQNPFLSIIITITTTELRKNKTYIFCYYVYHVQKNNNVLIRIFLSINDLL